MTPLYLLLTLSGIQLSSALPRTDASQTDSTLAFNNVAHLQVNVVVAPGSKAQDVANVSQPESVASLPAAPQSPSPAAASASAAAAIPEPVISIPVVSVAPPFEFIVVPATAAAPSSAAPQASPAAAVADVTDDQPISVPALASEPAAASAAVIPPSAPVRVVDSVVPSSPPAPVSVQAAPSAAAPAAAAAAASAASAVPVPASVAPAPSSSAIAVVNASPAPLPPAPAVVPTGAAASASSAVTAAASASQPSLVSVVVPQAAASPPSEVPAAAPAVQPSSATVESSSLVTPERISAVPSAAAASPSTVASAPVAAPPALSSSTVESSSVVTPEAASASVVPAQQSTPASRAASSSSSTFLGVRPASSAAQNLPVAQSSVSSGAGANSAASSASVNVPSSSAASSPSSSSVTSSSSGLAAITSTAIESSRLLSQSPAFSSQAAASSSSSATSARSSSTPSASSGRSSSSSTSSSVRMSSDVTRNSSVGSSATVAVPSDARSSAAKETTGKSSPSVSSLTRSQESRTIATESAEVETITTTLTSVIDRTRTLTFTSTVIRARPTATLIGTPEPAQTTRGQSAAPRPEPTVTTTVLTTVIDNKTVTRIVTITIVPTPAVPVPADPTSVARSSSVTAGADLGTTIVTSEVVQGGRTVTVTRTQTTTIPRIAEPSSSSPPLSFSSIAPPVFSSVVPSAPAPTSVNVMTRWTTLVTTLTTSQVQTLTTVVGVPQTTGTINTAVLSAGTSAAPFNTTVVPTPVGSIQPITSGSAVITGGRVAATTVSLAGNIFVPIGTQAPPSQIASQGGHPVPRLGITNQTTPPQTNKFYSNFYLGDRTAPTWTHPYSVAWANGSGVTGSWGIAVSHVNRSQIVFGPNNGKAASYYINPGGLQSVIISAAELGNRTSLTMSQLQAFSTNVNLAAAAGAPAVLSFPLVQGMAFVTGVFTKGTPVLQSSIFFSRLTYVGVVSGTSTVRYQVQLMDNTFWLIYMTPAAGSKVPTLTLVGNKQVVGNAAFTGSLQVAKNPSAVNSQTVYDNHAGVYPLLGAVQANVNKTVGRYSLSWTKAGLTNRTLLMFALPHHQQSFDNVTTAGLRTALSLYTTTKGLATAVHADSWTMVETNLPYDMGFAPWKGPGQGNGTITLSANARRTMNSVAGNELNQDFDAQTNLDSMYFSGKALAKYAAMVWATNNVVGNTSLASAGLVKLKSSFARFVNNKQVYPLVYDTVWGGAVSSATYKLNDSGVDFGNTYYNDHHFHYGYFVYTAAVIGFLDPSWLQQGSNKAWVNMLVRDYANPASNDGYFPFSRMFDWFVGHSWAHGLYATFDGKDEESSSEDTFASYGLKMWGRTIGDPNMEARGNLMLSIQARSLNDYFLMQSNNTIQPPQFIANKAAGITFENKVDHTTYFGTNIEYIEGIHMLPINPSSMLTRAQNFVREEWNAYFSNGRVDSIAGGWRGVLYSNLALIDPKASWNFFAASNFSNEYLDGGASRTFYLAMAAGLGGAS
ncbi:hypothetical protein FH972_021105 [Carpinus fangiana]|uniref:glucan endo-1,3-beta-D-glucosidase n=1 Tax=Carpinus fangiana TaxID=176857 RepID=A0A5N6KNR4_9ROSI|nr:hypothetical protein FH972_021105 [Carpinus fangiana]